MTACLRASAQANKILSNILMAREITVIYKSDKYIGHGMARQVVTYSFFKNGIILIA